MSFTCGLCGKPQVAGTKPVKVVTEKRDKIYPPQVLPKRKNEFRERDDDYDYRRRNEPEYGRQGKGWEIAAEVNACPKCLTKM
jgi:hypothetical protein